MSYATARGRLDTVYPAIASYGRRLSMPGGASVGYDACGLSFGGSQGAIIRSDTTPYHTVCPEHMFILCAQTLRPYCVRMPVCGCGLSFGGELVTHH